MSNLSGNRDVDWQVHTEPPKCCNDDCTQGRRCTDKAEIDFVELGYHVVFYVGLLILAAFLWSELT
jgi:hypothetical protein